MFGARILGKNWSFFLAWPLIVRLAWLKEEKLWDQHKVHQLWLSELLLGESRTAFFAICQLLKRIPLLYQDSPSRSLPSLQPTSNQFFRSPLSLFHLPLFSTSDLLLLLLPPLSFPPLLLSPNNRPLSPPRSSLATLKPPSSILGSQRYSSHVLGFLRHRRHTFRCVTRSLDRCLNTTTIF